jgi:hypothetical protein
MHVKMTRIESGITVPKDLFTLYLNVKIVTVKNFWPVARWPHGCRRKYSEVAVPMLVGLNPTEGGGFFQKKEPPPDHGCVCMSPRG